MRPACSAATSTETSSYYTQDPIPISRAPGAAQCRNAPATLPGASGAGDANRTRQLTALPASQRDNVAQPYSTSYHIDLAAVGAVPSGQEEDERPLSAEDMRAYREIDRLGSVDERPRLPVPDYLAGY